jgi:hypothetical protein
MTHRAAAEWLIVGASIAGWLLSAPAGSWHNGRRGGFSLCPGTDLAPFSLPDFAH